MMITHKKGEDYVDYYYTYSNVFANYPYFERNPVVQVGENSFLVFFQLTFPKKYIGWRTIQAEDNSEWNDSYEDRLPTIYGISTINQLLIESVVKIKKNNCCNENETFYCIII